MCTRRAVPRRRAPNFLSTSLSPECRLSSALRPVTGHHAPGPSAIPDDLCADRHTLAGSWLPPLLYPLADRVIAEWLDLSGALRKFRAVTVGAPPASREAEALMGDDGVVGYLVGLPLNGTDINRQCCINGLYRDLDRGLDNIAVDIFPVKPLTPDEYRYGQQLGNEGGVWLAEAFLKRGDGAQHWTGRQSVLKVPSLS